MAAVASLCCCTVSKFACASSGLPFEKSLYKQPSRIHLRKLSRGGWLVARLGRGGYMPRPAGVSKSSKNTGIADPNYDPALDLGKIQSLSVRLLDQQQNMVGIISKCDAIQRAEEAEMILAILSADADPPVLRLFEYADYKKHKYEQQKKKKLQMKRSAANRMDTKELKMRYNIDSHDYFVKLKAAQKFLKDGDKVKVIVNLKGRESQFKQDAVELIMRFQNDVGNIATESSKTFSERSFYIVLTPNKAELQRVQEQSDCVIPASVLQ